MAGRKNLWWQAAVSPLGAGASYVRGKQAETQLAGARQSMQLNMLMSAADMILQQQRDQAAKRAMMRALKDIDEEYGIGDTERAARNRQVIQRLSEDVGRETAAPMQEQAVAEAGKRDLSTRRRTAATGVGGSVKEEAERRSGRAFAGDIVAGGMARRAGKAGFLQGVEAERLGKRQMVRDQFGSEHIELPFGAVGRAAGMDTAADAARYEGIIPLAGEGAGLAIDIGKLVAGAA